MIVTISWTEEKDAKFLEELPLVYCAARKKYFLLLLLEL